MMLSGPSALSALVRLIARHNSFSMIMTGHSGDAEYCIHRDLTGLPPVEEARMSSSASPSFVERVTNDVGTS